MHAIPRLALSLTGCAFGIILAACSREPRFMSPRLGEVISIQPLAVNRQLTSETPQNSPLKLNIMWGGRMLTGEKGDTTLNFQDKTGKIRFSRSWIQLENAWRETGCSNRAVATLDGSLMGSALVCDGSLDLNGIVSIEGVDAKGEKRSATSWSVYRVNDDVTAVSIGLY